MNMRKYVVSTEWYKSGAGKIMYTASPYSVDASYLGKGSDDGIFQEHCNLLFL